MAQSRFHHFVSFGFTLNLCFFGTVGSSTALVQLGNTGSGAASFPFVFQRVAQSSPVYNGSSTSLLGQSTTGAIGGGMLSVIDSSVMIFLSLR